MNKYRVYVWRTTKEFLEVTVEAEDVDAAEDLALEQTREADPEMELSDIVWAVASGTELIQ